MEFTLLRKMPKLFAIATQLALLAFLLSATSHVNAVPKITPTVTVGMMPMYPPFEYHDNNKLVGFDVDLIHAICKELGCKVKVKEMSFQDLLPALKNNQIDIAISAINMTPERQKELDFSKSYYQQNKLVWVYPKYGFYPNSRNLHQLHVGVHSGTLMEKWAKDLQKQKRVSQVTSFPSTPILLERLKAKMIDAIIVEEIQAIQFCKQDPSFLTYHATGATIEGYGIAFNKGSPLVPKINKALEKLQSNGTMAKIYNQWIGKDILSP